MPLAYNLHADNKTIHTLRERIVEKSAPYSVSIDLSGYHLYPGFVNPHDHLELNHYPRTRFRDKYNNAHEWGEDVNARLSAPPYRELRAYSLKDRCFIGGLKNLLSGVTTVMQHGPLHPPLVKNNYPIRVLKDYGWTHSLHFNTEKEVVQSYRATPSNIPWFIHLAEGIDDTAASEYRRLEKLGCVGSNTVLVHGIGLSENDIHSAASNVHGLIICPTTNKYLIGRTANIDLWRANGGKTGIGSDSRLTATGDLLDELRIESVEQIPPIIEANASIVGFNYQTHADLIAVSVPPKSRADIQLVMYRGKPQLGNPDLMEQFPDVSLTPVNLDGEPKLMNVHLARQISRCTLVESGLTIEQSPAPRFWFF